MTLERERLLAEKARIEAELAKLDAEPDWGSAVDAFAMAYLEHAPDGAQVRHDWAKRGLIAALPLAPVAEPFDVEALARELVREHEIMGGKADNLLALRAIRETLRRRPWPSDAELHKMKSQSFAENSYDAMDNLALRIKAYQQGEGK